jgi:hypothetical protein
MTIGAAAAAGMGLAFFTLWWRRRRGKHYEDPTDLTIPFERQ